MPDWRRVDRGMGIFGGEWSITGGQWVKGHGTRELGDTVGRIGQVLEASV